VLDGTPRNQLLNSGPSRAGSAGNPAEMSHILHEKASHGSPFAVFIVGVGYDGADEGNLRRLPRQSIERGGVATRLRLTVSPNAVIATFPFGNSFDQNAPPLGN
jgi:hypothetical protein